MRWYDHIPGVTAGVLLLIGMLLMAYYG